MLSERGFVSRREHAVQPAAARPCGGRLSMPVLRKAAPHLLVLRSPGAPSGRATIGRRSRHRRSGARHRRSRIPLRTVLRFARRGSNLIAPGRAARFRRRRRRPRWCGARLARDLRVARARHGCEHQLGGADQGHRATPAHRYRRAENRDVRMAIADHQRISRASTAWPKARSFRRSTANGTGGRERVAFGGVPVTFNVFQVTAQRAVGARFLGTAATQHASGARRLAVLAGGPTRRRALAHQRCCDRPISQLARARSRSRHFAAHAGVATARPCSSRNGAISRGSSPSSTFASSSREVDNLAPSRIAISSARSRSRRMR